MTRIILNKNIKYLVISRCLSTRVQVGAVSSLPITPTKKKTGTEVKWKTWRRRMSTHLGLIDWTDRPQCPRWHCGHMLSACGRSARQQERLCMCSCRARGGAGPPRRPVDLCPPQDPRGGSCSSALITSPWSL